MDFNVIAGAHPDPVIQNAILDTSFIFNDESNEKHVVTNIATSRGHDIAAVLPKIKRAPVRGITAMNGATNAAYLDMFTMFRETLSNVYLRITDNPVFVCKRMMAAMPPIRSLNIYKSSEAVYLLNDGVVGSLSDLSLYRMTIGSLSHLNVTSLSLMDVKIIPIDNVKYIPDSVTDLHLRGVSMRYTHLASHLKLKKLEIDITDLRYDRNTSEFILSHAETLEHLTIFGSSHPLNFISKMKKLRSLNIVGCGACVEEIMSILDALGPQLKTFCTDYQPILEPYIRNTWPHIRLII